MFRKFSANIAILSLLLLSLFLHIYSKNKNLEPKTQIPLVLASDKDFALPLYISLFSILENANDDTFYDIYLLVTQNFEDIFREKISELGKQYNCNIRFIKIDNKDFDLAEDQPLHATYFRLLIPDLLSEHKKCIYLDSDLIALSDLTELYNVDLSDDYIAGVRDFPSVFTYKKMYLNAIPQKLDKIIDLLDFTNYVNAGVLVMNLDLLRKCDMVEKFKLMVQHESESPYPYHDQDIINIACNGHIKCIDLKYNFMSNFLDIIEENLDQTGYTESEFEEAFKAPVIIHYAMEKPWEESYNSFAMIWWNYAHKAPFFDKLSKKCAQFRTDQDINYYTKYCLSRFHYWRCKFLSNITSGKIKQYYQSKTEQMRRKATQSEHFFQIYRYE